MAKQLPVTEFDILTLPDYLQLFKALIPFMEYGMQKKLSMLIRANELKHTLSFYNSPYSCNTFKTCSNSSGINANTSLNDILNNEAIMKTIMAYCPDNIEQLINTYRNFSKMSDMLGMMDMFNNASGDNSLIMLIQAVLTMPVLMNLTIIILMIILNLVILIITLALVDLTI